jgi:hypothetical protein
MWFAPQPIARLELLRVLVPLALLGFLASRIAHADDWLGPAGFHIPDLRGSNWRQAVYLAPLPVWGAWTVAGAIVASSLALAAGWCTRAASAALTLLCAYVALADRLETFTVSKIAPVLTLSLFLSPAGARWSVDAWLRRRRVANVPPARFVAGGAVRFCQVFLMVFYSGAGLAKLQGGWANEPVLWTHVHDSYQTTVSFALQRVLPGAAWVVLQWATLIFEVGAPLWLTFRWTRMPALLVGIGMHTMIGLMFGPVIWFALLMISLLLAGYAPLPKRFTEDQRAS